MGSKEINLSIQIPVRLYEELKTQASERKFSNVENYVVHLLGTTLRDATPNSGDPFDEREDEELRKRLKSLGYT